MPLFALPEKKNYFVQKNHLNPRRSRHKYDSNKRYIHFVDLNKVLYFIFINEPYDFNKFRYIIQFLVLSPGIGSDGFSYGGGDILLR